MTPKRTCKATSNNAYSALLSPYWFYCLTHMTLQLKTPDWPICVIANLCQYLFNIVC